MVNMLNRDEYEAHQRQRAIELGCTYLEAAPPRKLFEGYDFGPPQSRPHDCPACQYCYMIPLALSESSLRYVTCTKCGRDMLGNELVVAVVEKKEREVVISDNPDLSALVDKVIVSNERAVADYKSGKVKAMGWLVGMVMKEMKAADPEEVKLRLETLLQDQGSDQGRSS